MGCQNKADYIKKIRIKADFSSQRIDFGVTFNQRARATVSLW